MNRNAIIGVGLGALILYLLAKSGALGAQAQQTVGLAATTSPSGSSSGVLTPVFNSVSSTLSGIEAFLHPGNVVQAEPIIGSDASSLIGASAQPEQIQYSDLDTTSMYSADEESS